MNKEQELEKLQSYAIENNTTNSNSNSSELVEMEEIEDTPFTIIGNEEQGYFIAFGKYRVSDKTETKEESLNYFNNKSWTILINTIGAMINIHETSKNI